jgi:hypothetical protein
LEAYFDLRTSKPSVGDQPLSHVDYLKSLVAEAAIELDRFEIVGPDLKIDLRAASFHQKSLGLQHHCSSNPHLPVRRKHPDIVDRAAVAVVSGHQAPDHRPGHFGDEKQPVIGCLLAGDIEMRVVPASPQATRLPQGDHLSVVAWHEESDL